MRYYKNVAFNVIFDGSSDYNTVIQIYYFVITSTESETKKMMSVLMRMSDGEIYSIFSIFKLYIQHEFKSNFNTLIKCIANIFITNYKYVNSTL